MLPVFPGSYFISYQRCCRNNTITNIVDPQSSGATYTVEITDTAQLSCNNSPTFNDFPPIVVCLGEDIDFDHAATDKEGDQLVYSFCAPLLGGGPYGTMEFPGDPQACNGVSPNPSRCLPPYTDVRFQPAYNVNTPMAGNPVIRINPNTGLISGVPDNQGQYVVGVCVTEYRGGVKMGSIQRDFQFNIAQCDPTVFAQVMADTNFQRNYQINSCGSFTIDFVNNSFQEQFINSYLWEFDIRGQLETYATKNATVTFPGLGNYLGKMVLNRGSECSDSVNLSVNVYPDIHSDFEFSYDTCVAGPVLFKDKSSTGAPGGLIGWEWNFGEGGVSSRQNPQYKYPIPGNHLASLTVEDDNGCRETKSYSVSYFPVPSLIIIEPSTYRGCAPANIFFNNLSTPIDSTYDINWDFGDGMFGTEISPFHLYDEEGTYNISIDITSPIGCTTSASFDDLITVRPSPEAGFDFTPEEPKSTSPTITFKDKSKFAINWRWLFGDEGISTTNNPIYTFQDTGVYHVRQIVIHESGCTDTAFSFIDIKPDVLYFLPNAFTPNGDGFNDIYFGKGNLAWMNDYEFSIWNRWGQRLFLTNNPDEGWNGRIDNIGTDVPPGVYVAIVRYTDPRGDGQEIKGLATVIR